MADARGQGVAATAKETPLHELMHWLVFYEMEAGVMPDTATTTTVPRAALDRPQTAEEAIRELSKVVGADVFK